MPAACPLEDQSVSVVAVQRPNLSFNKAPAGVRREPSAVRLPWQHLPDFEPPDAPRLASSSRFGLRRRSTGETASPKASPVRAGTPSSGSKIEHVEATRRCPSRLRVKAELVIKSALSFTSSHRRPNPDIINRWQCAIRKVMHCIAFSHALHTLRDMADSTLIRPDQLVHVKSLGAGSFAKVELCHYTPKDSAASVLVAVKRLKADVVMRDINRETFQQEVSLLRKLRCGHIVELIGVGYSDRTRKLETMFMVQEYMNCGSLQRLLADQMRTSKRLFSNADALRWALQVARGLAYLHEAKPMVIHRDLKLENILLSSPGKDVHAMEAKLADFGLVALIKRRNEVESPRTSAHALTPTSSPQEMQEAWDSRTVRRARDSAHKLFRRAGASGLYSLTGMTGSLLYMAPEVFCKMRYNEKVDVFSFGVVLFELFNRYMMLAAVTMVASPQELDQYAERVSQGYRPPLDPQIPPSLRSLIQSCWAQDPQARPAMPDVVHSLLQIQRDGDVDEWDRRDASASRGCSACVIC